MTMKLLLVGIDWVLWVDLESKAFNTMGLRF